MLEIMHEYCKRISTMFMFPRTPQQTSWNIHMLVNTCISWFKIRVSILIEAILPTFQKYIRFNY